MVGLRIVGLGLERAGAHARERDLVTGEEGPGCQRIFDGREGGEIAPPHGHGRHGCEGARTLSLPIALPTEHEERAVAAIVNLRDKDRAAHHAAKLVLPVFRYRRGEKIPGIEFVVAQELKQRAVDPVATRLDHHVHHTARKASEFRGISAGLYLEFLDRIDAET